MSPRTTTSKGGSPARAVSASVIDAARRSTSGYRLTAAATTSAAVSVRIVARGARAAGCVAPDRSAGGARDPPVEGARKVFEPITGAEARHPDRAAVEH